MTDNPGRIAFLAAAKIVEDAVATAPSPTDRGFYLRWAREQLQFQAIQHLRTHPGHPNALFMYNITNAIKVLDDTIADAPPGARQ